MIFYKLRSKNDPELFVKGTPHYQNLDKKGRVFQTLGALRTFITGVMTIDRAYNENSNNQHNRISEWDVVEYEIVEKEVKGIHEIITAKKLKELIMR